MTAELDVIEPGVIAEKVGAFLSRSRARLPANAALHTPNKVNTHTTKKSLCFKFLTSVLLGPDSGGESVLDSTRWEPRTDCSGNQFDEWLPVA